MGNIINPQPQEEQTDHKDNRNYFFILNMSDIIEADLMNWSPFRKDKIFRRNSVVKINRFLLKTKQTLLQLNCWQNQLLSFCPNCCEAPQQKLHPLYKNKLTEVI